MNKTKIDWADITWNPVTGCLHDCHYCYARKIATRFSNWGFLPENRPVAFSDDIPNGIGLLHCLDKPYDKQGKKEPFPFKFEPTLHRYRLTHPKNINKPQNIFVCSMADLFGEWVPDGWIKEVFKACDEAPHHRYMFLTKNPKRYLNLYKYKKFPWKENYWFGTTITRPSDEFVWVKDTPYKTFVSIEPIMAPFGKLENGKMPDWVIVGAETGNRKGKVKPEKHWIEEIVSQCQERKVPIFMKESLRNLMEEDFRQEFPWEGV